MTALTTEHTAAPITPEQFVELPEARHAELVDGALLERPGMSRESSLVTTQLIFHLMLFLRDQPLGRVMETQATYQCFAHKPKQVRRPDVSFVLTDNLAAESFRGHIRQPPDLVAEVVSPYDSAHDIQDRCDDFRQAGVKLIWVIYSTNRVARIYRGEAIREIGPEGVLEGEPVLPGFRCRLSELFAGLPEAAPSEDRSADH